MALKGSKSHKENLAKSKDFQGFLEEFQNENDRSAAIIGAAFLDENLKQLLTNFLVDDEKKWLISFLVNHLWVRSAHESGRHIA
jgi:hypothetical protein